jgi:hypothetical protein
VGPESNPEIAKRINDTIQSFLETYTNDFIYDTTDDFTGITGTYFYLHCQVILARRID